jgi:hypothetical protein
MAVLKAQKKWKYSIRTAMLSTDKSQVAASVYLGILCSPCSDDSS